MSLPIQKRSTLKVSSREFPDPPEMPESLSKDNIRAFNKSMKAWWEPVKTKLLEMDTEIQNL